VSKRGGSAGWAFETEPGETNMTKWFQWVVLTSITGSPLVSIVILMAFWWAADHYTLGLLPDPVRLVRRFFRVGALERTLQQNPNDRRARLELATLLVDRKRYAKALPLVKANLEAGDDEPNTLFVMAQACFGAGHHDQGELLLKELDERDPKFRMGEVHLERARWRLQRKDAKGAVEALTQLLVMRPGTVEGKVLLAKAHDALGDDSAAAFARRDAWADYAASPRFVQRKERFWAWRANPARPALYLATAVV
jgi:predicted Zn-dependent protease